MVTADHREDIGGNYVQPADGRNEAGELPEPLDAARDLDDKDAIILPGMAPSQPKGTGPVVSSPTGPAPTEAEARKDSDAEARKATKAAGLSTKNTPTRQAGEQK